MTFCNDDIESVFIEIKDNQLSSNKKLTVGVLYRPPTANAETFISHLSDMLLSIANSKNACIIMGDFNLNLRNVDKHAHTQQFLETLYCHSYLPLINRPTRIDPSTGSISLIDNIFFNDFINTKTSQGVLVNDITDHFQVFCKLNSVKIQGLPNMQTKRVYSAKAINNLKNRLQNMGCI